MKHFRIRAMTYFVIVLLGLLSALPSLLPQHWLADLPARVQNHTLTLGLDLQGGSHLLLNADTRPLLAEQTLQFGEELARELSRMGITYRPPVSQNTADDSTAVVISLRHSSDLEQALLAVRHSQAGEVPARFDVTHSTTDQGVDLMLTPSRAFQASLEEDAVERSLEVVRRRLDETGVVEPLITRQGNQGILVQLPGVEDPGQVKTLLGRTARLTFHLVTTTDSDRATILVPAAPTEQRPDGTLYRLERQQLLEGGHLKDARLGFDPDTREPLVTFRLNSEGSARFADVTRAHIGRAFAVVLDGEVITAPVIRSPITGGSGQISGGFSTREATELALLLRAGALPAPLTVAEERTVGPELGADAIRMGVSTGILGALLILGFMLMAYGRWGLIANAALVVYTGLVVAVLALFGATLTLPGIAGLILSLGMAVDANILINERIREEARRGSSARFAVHQGFQRAFGTILDSNITTLIAVGLLFLFGSGPIRGFAVTMAVGLTVSLFTSVGFTRVIMEWRVRQLGQAPLRVPARRWLARMDGHTTIPFLRARAPALALSMILSMASLGALVWPGLNPGIDFQGGTLIEVQTPSPVPIEHLRQALTAMPQAGIQSFGNDQHYLIRLPVMDSSHAAPAIDEVRDTLKETFGDVRFPKVDMVGPSVSQQFLDTSLLALLLAGLGMFAYIAFRFEGHFASAAMITLALDLTKTLGFLAITGVEFNLTAVAALLALIGYSVNDKVVVFDRIRELQGQHPERPFRDIITASLNATLTRTLFTSVTTFLAILPMALAGGEAVRSFALPMLFGIVAGTGSSLLIAAPLADLFRRRTLNRARAEEQRRLDRGEEVPLFLREDRP